MDQINQLLIENFGPLGPIAAMGLAGTVLILVALIIFVSQRPDPFSNINKHDKSAAAKEESKALRLEASGTDKLDKYAGFLEPQSEEEMSASKLKLLQAGYRAPSSVRVFHFAQMALGLCFLVLGLVYTLLTGGGEFDPKSLALTVILPGAVGYYLPIYWVERRKQSRQDEIQDGFPDSLDLMLVCVEAGQSLDQSIIRVAREIRTGFPALADEFEIVAYEIKAGKDKVVVLKDMGDRCGVPDISSFVTVLIQSATFGTSIAEALRVYASEMRDKRVMRAEEKANIIPTKLTLGTMMFTVPPLMIIMIGPSVYDIYRNLGGGG